jgi:citrate/tricarballylate utilization protein
MPALPDLVEEAARQLSVCNACRYCEGYCAVFPALERRSILTRGDVAYLANLCHDCRACYQACMYTPPHEFGVDIPLAMSSVRAATYEEYATPRAVRALFRQSGPAAAGATAAGVVLALLAVGVAGNLGGLGAAHTGPGAFYRVVPFYLMMVPALLAGAFVVAVMVAGGLLFWDAAGGRRRDLLSLGAVARAAADALRLRFLGGGGGGCYYPDEERPSSARRWLHSLVFYGFAAAFVSTVLAAIWQDLLRRQPPFPILSAPVLFGIAGGLAMVAGATGLLLLKWRSERRLEDPRLVAMDVAFITVLDLAAATGLLLLALRDTPAMGALLVAHLAVLTALYATAPYGKFVHFVYRLAALVLNRLEEAA